MGKPRATDGVRSKHRKELKRQRKSLRLDLPVTTYTRLLQLLRPGESCVAGIARLIEEKTT